LTLLLVLCQHKPPVRQDAGYQMQVAAPHAHSSWGLWILFAGHIVQKLQPFVSGFAKLAAVVVEEAAVVEAAAAAEAEEEGEFPENVASGTKRDVATCGCPRAPRVPEGERYRAEMDLSCLAGSRAAPLMFVEWLVLILDRIGVSITRRAQVLCPSFDCC